MAEYSDQLADSICKKFAEGPATIRGICRELGIGTATFFQWLNQNEYFQKQYARAKEAQAHLLADEIEEIARTPEIGEVVTTKPQGTEVRRGDMTEHRRLKIDALKWRASKLYPKVYNERHVLAGDPEAPVQTVSQIVVKDATTASDVAGLTKGE